LVVREGNLLFSLSFKNLLLFEVIAVNIAILSPLVWCCWLGNVKIIVIMKSSDLLILNLLIAVSSELTWCNNLLVVLVHAADRVKLLAIHNI
jgi:hypothetical protein